MTKTIVPMGLTQTSSPSRHYSFIAFIVIVMLLLTSCAATQPPISPEGDLPGFWLGLWHGFIAPITFIISLFSGIRIYAFPNAGLWYDFGFMLGISGFSGGVFAGSRRKRERN
jgi:ABC-type multidrug transport system permease subunit